jgi:hypothetical protein
MGSIVGHSDGLAASIIDVLLICEIANVVVDVGGNEKGR